MIAIPFYEIILYFFIPGRTYPEFHDMWFTKDFIAMACSLLIGLYVLATEGFKPIKEPFLFGFLIFLVFNIFKIPNGIIPLGGINLNGLWNYAPAFQCLVFFILFIGVISSSQINEDLLFNIARWCGFAMSAYMILQAIGADQIFNLFPPEVVLETRNPLVGGTIGQATLSAPFIVMCLPFQMRRNTILPVVSAVAVWLSGSVVAMGVVIIILILKAMKKKNILNKKYIFILIGVCIVLLALSFSSKLSFFNDNGRYNFWAKTIGHIIHDKIILTGAGIGSYKFLFAVKHGNAWYQAHNEYLQLLFSTGIIGFTLMFLFIKNIFTRTVKCLNDSKTFMVFLSILSVLICAGGTFVFQLAPYQFYFVVFLGILYKKTREVDYAGK